MTAAPWPIILVGYLWCAAVVAMIVMVLGLLAADVRREHRENVERRQLEAARRVTSPLRSVPSPRRTVEPGPFARHGGGR